MRVGGEERKVPHSLRPVKNGWALGSERWMRGDLTFLRWAWRFRDKSRSLNACSCQRCTIIMIPDMLTTHIRRLPS